MPVQQSRHDPALQHQRVDPDKVAARPYRAHIVRRQRVENLRDNVTPVEVRAHLSLATYESRL